MVMFLLLATFIAVSSVAAGLWVFFASDIADYWRRSRG